MSEYLRIASSEQATTRTNQPFVKVHLADGSQVTCFDTALFPKILGQAAIQAEVDRSRPQYPKITAVLAGGAVPSDGGTPIASAPSDRDLLIMRQVALKCAVEAAGLVGGTSEARSDYQMVVRLMAENFLDWLENPAPF